MDSDNTFVAEYLLRAAADDNPSVFFRQVQAGFVLSYWEPRNLYCPSDDGGEDTVAQKTDSNAENLTVTVWYNNQVSLSCMYLRIYMYMHIHVCTCKYNNNVYVQELCICTVACDQWPKPETVTAVYILHFFVQKSTISHYA